MIGNADEQEPSGALERGNTERQVDQLAKQRKNVLIACAVQGLSSLVIVALDIVGLASKADEACDSKPLEWETFFLVHAIIAGSCLVLNVMVLYGASLVNNRAMIRGQLHLAKGAEAEAEKDIEEGQALALKGLKIMGLPACLVSLAALFSLAWLILGIVTYADNDSEACGPARNWMWTVFCVCLSMQLLSSCMKPNMKPKQAT